MNNLQTVADKLNIIADFLALRDIPVLTNEELLKKYDIQQADMLILFGGNIIHGCKMAAQSYLQGIAKQMMIVGGEGHTTDTLRKLIHSRYPEFKTDDKSESECIAYMLEKEYGITGLILETKSTNCGNNVSNALSVLEANGLNPQFIIIMQDSTMQHRMDAGFKKCGAINKPNLSTMLHIELRL